LRQRGRLPAREGSGWTIFFHGFPPTVTRCFVRAPDSGFVATEGGRRKPPDICGLFLFDAAGLAEGLRAAQPSRLRWVPRRAFARTDSWSVPPENQFVRAFRSPLSRLMLPRSDGIGFLRRKPKRGGRCRCAHRPNRFWHRGHWPQHPPEYRRARLESAIAACQIGFHSAQSSCIAWARARSAIEIRHCGVASRRLELMIALPVLPSSSHGIAGRVEDLRAQLARMHAHAQRVWGVGRDAPSACASIPPCHGGAICPARLRPVQSLWWHWRKQRVN